MARPFFVSPDVPGDTVKVLRQAFLDTLKDPVFIKEAEKLRLEINPTSGEEVENLIGKVFGSPPDVVKRIAELLK
jgi:tripartite-type tricarboxylate transporter receptor subunit TctC